MSVIVRDDGFHADDLDAATLAEGQRIDIPQDTAPESLPDVSGARLVTVAFPSFSDGRGFTLARHLRAAGYGGRLRAVGHVIADQYAMARRCGFDEVEISDDLAARQPADQWRFRADWQANDYQKRLRA
ncbi:MAG: DUF934 domain-containing protein [Paracoccaceae bacterium]